MLNGRPKYDYRCVWQTNIQSESAMDTHGQRICMDLLPNFQCSGSCDSCALFFWGPNNTLSHVVWCCSCALCISSLETSDESSSWNKLECFFRLRYVAELNRKYFQPEGYCLCVGTDISCVCKSTCSVCLDYVRAKLSLSCLRLRNYTRVCGWFQVFANVGARVHVDKRLSGHPCFLFYTCLWC